MSRTKGRSQLQFAAGDALLPLAAALGTLYWVQGIGWETLKVAAIVGLVVVAIRLREYVGS